MKTATYLQVIRSMVYATLLSIACFVSVLLSLQLCRVSNFNKFEHVTCVIFFLIWGRNDVCFITEVVQEPTVSFLVSQILF